jgi:hypothetical protein
MDVVNRLITSRRFWIAVLAVVLTGASVAFPQIPAPMVEAFRVFALALIAAFTIEDSAKALASR